MNAAPSDRIKTFAFYDLETTGLPDLEFYKTKITELSIVACSVDHLLEGSIDVPRIQQKLTLCFNPFKRIDLKATEITGLTNELLENEKKFDKNAMNLLECFLFQLQQPVCLIAHNGDKLDFPLLKKQYTLHDGTFPYTLKCCDSLPVFRKIDELMEQRAELLRTTSIQQLSEARNGGLLDNVEDERLVEVVEGTSSNGIDEAFHALVKEELEEIDRAERENKNQISRQTINETTPSKPTKPTNLQPHATSTFAMRTRPVASKRELFPTTQQPTKGKFSLREIYKRFFNSYPAHSHDAESDVISLLKCAVACNNDFVQLVNETCVEFKDVKVF